MSEGSDTVALPGFDAGTAIEALGEGRFAATMSERWWVGRGPNGGSPLPPAAATPEDAYLIAFHSNVARHGFFEEDGELWLADGTLLAQSRQLALLLDPPDGG